ncbi:MAG: methionine gamma-lyase [Fimbriimonadaceae bacterium]|nr:methionine gamma-lyase [Fimbriimonadaceae bacterium]
MERQHAGFATRAIHHGHDPYAGAGGLTPPVHVSSTYTFPTAQDGGARFAGEAPGHVYSRLGNPTLDLLERRLASLEGAEAAVVTGSGMGAVASLLWTMLRPGDVLLADQTLYGCTFSYFHHGLAEFGVEIRHIDLTKPGEVARHATPQAKGVYFETPANPNMRVVDIEAVAAEAHAAGLWVAVDNTYMTPYLQRPVELGADFVVHSATKYLGGHGDLLAGAVVGSAESMHSVRMKGVKDYTGACMSAFDAHLVLRGVKTLALRMDRHCANAMAVAEFLAAHPAVAKVYYPGLKGDAGHETNRRQARGPGGMVAFDVVGGLESAQAFLDRLELVVRAVSLGDCESLAQHPASMTHSTYTPEERARHGIGDGLVRMSVGLEDVDDILDDVRQALDAVPRTFHLAG